MPCTAANTKRAATAEAAMQALNMIFRCILAIFRLSLALTKNLAALQPVHNPMFNRMRDSNGLNKVDRDCKATGCNLVRY